MINLPRNSCTGCGACLQICSVGCVEFKEDDFGFLYPIIDNDNCIECKACIDICPELNIEKIKTAKPIKVVAAYAKENEIAMRGSSGGVFELLAKCFLDMDGVVYGVELDSNFMAKHIRVTKVEDLFELNGSKYVQSDTNTTFRQVKDDLKNEYKVLFSGTPCQISGLRSFLKKEYANLFLIELVCHGVPSNKIFKQYINWVNDKNGFNIKEISFRDKTKLGWGLNLTFEVIDKKALRQVHGKALLDPYYSMFLHGDIYRECCYSCNYARESRVADITLGDFWGIEKVISDLPSTQGVSVVLLCSAKAIEIIDNISEKLEIRESNFNDASLKNKNLRETTQKSKNRDLLMNSYKKYGFEEMVKIWRMEYKKEILIQYLKSLLPVKFKNIIKRILRYIEH